MRQIDKSGGYESGFSAALEAAGMPKKASCEMAKKAAYGRAARNIFSGVTNLAGASRLPVGLAELGITGASDVARALSFLNTSSGSISNSVVNVLARALGNRYVGAVPILGDFGRGFAGAQATWLRGGRPQSLMHTLGVGRGSLVGNTLHGIGGVAAAHPIVGGSLFAIPAVAVANNSRSANELLGNVSTLTPVEDRIFNRDFKFSGYAGLDGEDIRGFDPFRLLSK